MSVLKTLGQWTQKIGTMLIVFLVITSVYLFVKVQNQQSVFQHDIAKREQVTCGFYHSLSVFPVPYTAKPIPQSDSWIVSLIVNSRNVYVNDQCTPHLAPPSPGLVKDGAQFGIPVPN